MLQSALSILKLLLNASLFIPYDPFMHEAYELLRAFTVFTRVVVKSLFNMFRLNKRLH